MDAKFCFTCGHILGVHYRAAYYDEETGEPVKYPDYSCPARRWYHVLLHRHPATKGEVYASFGV